MADPVIAADGNTYERSHGGVAAAPHHLSQDWLPAAPQAPGAQCYCQDSHPQSPAAKQMNLLCRQLLAYRQPGNEPLSLLRCAEDKSQVYKQMLLSLHKASTLASFALWSLKHSAKGDRTLENLFLCRAVVSQVAAGCIIRTA